MNYRRGRILVEELEVGEREFGEPEVKKREFIEL